MHKMIPAALALILAPSLTVTAFGIRADEAHAGVAPHWTYAGATGPEHWGELDTGFATCASGVNQSPIDIHSTLDADLPPLRVDYQGRGAEILNNDHTIQVNVAPGSILTLEGTPFELKQFHFHAPSENTVDGASCKTLREMRLFSERVALPIGQVGAGAWRGRSFCGLDMQTIWNVRRSSQEPPSGTSMMPCRERSAAWAWDYVTKLRSWSAVRAKIPNIKWHMTLA